MIRDDSMVLVVTEDNKLILVEFNGGHLPGSSGNKCVIVVHGEFRI
jgi:hypothetical protein